jgi:hypothetical protein
LSVQSSWIDSSSAVWGKVIAVYYVVIRPLSGNSMQVDWVPSVAARLAGGGVSETATAGKPCCYR